MTTTDKPHVTLADGRSVPEDGSHRELKANGQQRDYVVLSAEERAKGYVKPVRRSYIHRGPDRLPDNLRDLTPEEHARYDQYGYVKYQPYGENGAGLLGRYWTQPEIDRAGKRCGAVTTTSQAIAETYARDPNFYSGTFCYACGTHYPLKEFEWEDGEPMDPSRQEAWPTDWEAARRDVQANMRDYVVGHDVSVMAEFKRDSEGKITDLKIISAALGPDLEKKIRAEEAVADMRGHIDWLSNFASLLDAVHHDECITPQTVIDCAIECTRVEMVAKNSRADDKNS